jgi:transcriptional regulator with XRE-family HTH domain
MDQRQNNAKTITRTYSRYTREACSLLGGLICTARKEHKLTAQEVADRAGISRGLLQRIEKGDLKCEIGVVFEVATIVGVQLFDTDESTLRKHLRQTEDKLALLPKSVRKKTRVVHDEF